MRYLKRFDESFDDALGLTSGDLDSWVRIEDNVKDIFVEYSDAHDLDVVVGRGHLPLTVVGLDDKVIEVKLFEQRGIRYANISEEVGMLIDYMKSLTDKEVKIYYDIDRSGLRNWRPLADNSELEHDYYLSGTTHSFNTIRLYFVECVEKGLNESLAINFDKMVGDITDMFIELKDQGGITFLVSKDGDNGIGITIYTKKRGAHLDMDLIKDCVEMTKDYLSDFGDFTEFYRFGFVWEGVNTKISNQGTAVNFKSTMRDNLEYSKFPEDIHADIETKFDLVYKFGYEIEGIKIVYKFK